MQSYDFQGMTFSFSSYSA